MRSHLKSKPLGFSSFSPLGSDNGPVSALSPIRRRILSNLSCLMKNSATRLPISAVAGCCVRYRGEGAGKGRGNCFGLQHCMTSIINAVELVHPEILQRPLRRTIAGIRCQSSRGGLGVCQASACGLPGYVTLGGGEDEPSAKLRPDSFPNLEGTSTVSD